MKTTEFQKLMIDHVGIINDQINELTSLSLAQLNWKESPARWSILECIEHLNRYNRYYIDEAELNLKKADKHDDEIMSTWIGRKSIAMMNPTNRKKQKTFKRMDPSNSKLTIEVFQRFRLDQERILRLLQKLPVANANAKVVKVEFFKLLKMTIAETLEFLIVHQQRHLLQMLDIKTKLSERRTPASLVV